MEQQGQKTTINPTKRRFKIKYIVFAVVVGLISLIYNLEPQPNLVNYKAEHVEILKEGNLLDSNGRLIDSGYATRPLKVLNEEDIRPFLGLKYLNKYRYKKWDFFDATNDDVQVLIHFADLGYVANVQMLVFFHQNNQILQISDNIYDLSKMPSLPRHSNRFEGEYSYSSETMQIQVKYTPSRINNNKNEHKVQIKFNSTIFSGDLTYTKKVQDHEIVMLTPLTEDRTNFYYNTKTYCMGIKGRIDFTNKDIKPLIFDPSSTGGGRDIGRGVWNYFTYWFWAFGQGTVVDHDAIRKFIGIDLGNGFEMENSTTYEDSIFVGGKITKLFPVKRIIDTKDFSKPWILYTEQKYAPGSLDAKFYPLATNLKNENKILINIQFQQFFGYFSGKFTNYLGHEIEFKNVYGFCEVHKAKW